jgi:hypothetical protein
MIETRTVAAMTQTANAISPELQKLWRTAVFTIKQSQEKFLEAYRKTLDHYCPNWSGTWRNDPHFPRALGDIEKTIWAMCKDNGMNLTTYNRFRGAARKSLLMGVPFNIAAGNFSIQELAEIKAGGNEVAKQMRRQKGVKRALSLLGQSATVIPGEPASGEHPEDYLQSVKQALTVSLAKVKEICGEKAARQLLAELLTA